MKKSLYLALFLAWICAIAGGLLALANYSTAPIIAANKVQAEAANFAKIFGDDTKYSPVEITETNSITQIFTAGEKGYAYKVLVTGFQSPIEFIVGIDSTGQIIGYEVLACGDTPGFGLKVQEDEYKGVITSSNISDEIDTISGATISSKAVVDGLKDVKAHFEANFK